MRDYAVELEKRVAFIQDVLSKSGAKGIVFGNSGGKDSALVEKFNEFWAAASADGSLESTAKKYGVQEAIIKK